MKNKSLSRCSRSISRQGLREESEWIREYAEIIDNIPVAMLIVDIRLRILKANKRAADFALIPAKSFIGMKAGDAFKCAHSFESVRGCGHASFCLKCPAYVCVWNVLKKGKNSFGVEFQLPFVREGKITETFISFSALLIRGPGGAPAVLIYAEDISARKEKEIAMLKGRAASENNMRIRNAELFSVLEKLDQARKLSEIGTLSAEVAHELRNPLATIKIAIYNIKQKIDVSGAESNIHNIEKKIQEAEQIIDNLLHYSSLHPPRYGKVKIHPLLKQCVKAAREKYKEKNVKITIKPAAAADTALDADSVQLSEVFSNILNNAFEAIMHGHGKIEVKPVLCGKNNVAVIFRDNGSGIKPDDMDSVKKAFFTRKTRGTGLGLTVSSQIVYLHGGEIKIKSSLRSGTSVSVSLPLKRLSR